MQHYASAVIRLLGNIGNNVTVCPGYVIATTLKHGYLRTAQESSRYSRLLLVV